MTTHHVASFRCNPFATYLVSSAIVFLHSDLVWRSVRLSIKLTCFILSEISIDPVIHIISCHYFFLFCSLPCLASVVGMSSFSRPNARCPEFRDPTAFLVSWYVHEYLNSLDYWFCEPMDHNGIALKIRDRETTPANFVDVWVKRWLPCRCLGMSHSRCNRSKEDMPVAPCYEEV